MNNKVMEIVETKLAPFANKLASQRHLKCAKCILIMYAFYDYWKFRIDFLGTSSRLYDA